MATSCTMSRTHRRPSTVARTRRSSRSRRSGPTAARVLGFRFADRQPAERESGHLTFHKEPIPTELIRAQLADPAGARLFHRVPQAVEPEDLWALR